MSKDTWRQVLKAGIKAAQLPPDIVRHLERLQAAVDAGSAPIPTCAVHPGQRLVCPACAGSWGGRVTSDRKARASRANGKKGGRPRKVKRRTTPP